MTHSHASLAGTVGVAEGLALVADFTNSDTLAQASILDEDTGELDAGALDTGAVTLALAVALATLEDDGYAEG